MFKKRLFIIFFLVGCWSPTPSDVRIIIEGKAAQNLVSGIGVEHFKIYYLNQQQLRAISDIYMDTLLVEKFLSERSVSDFDILIKSLYSNRLRDFYAQKLPLAIAQLDIQSAEYKYAAKLSELKSDAELAYFKYLNTNKKLERVKALDAEQTQLTDEINVKEQAAKARLITLQESVDFKISEHNKKYTHNPLSYSELALANYNVSQQQASNCNRFRQFNLRIFYNGYCFLKNVHENLSFGDDFRQNYKEIFSEYVATRYLLSRSSPPLKNTFQDEMHALTYDFKDKRNALLNKFGGSKKLNEDLSLAEANQKKKQYLVDSYITNKNREIKTLLGEPYNAITKQVKDGVNLSSSKSPLFQDALVAMKSINAITVDEQLRAPYHGDAMMTLAQVDSIDRDLFPIFVKPVIIDQRNIAEMEHVQLRLAHDNIEYVSEDGVIDTLVTLIGEAFIEWKTRQ